MNTIEHLNQQLPEKRNPESTMEMGDNDNITIIPKEGDGHDAFALIEQKVKGPCGSQTTGKRTTNDTVIFPGICAYLLVDWSFMTFKNNTDSMRFAQEYVYFIQTTSYFKSQHMYQKFISSQHKSVILPLTTKRKQSKKIQARLEFDDDVTGERVDFLEVDAV